MSRNSHCRSCNSPIDGDHDICMSCYLQLREERMAARLNAARHAVDAVERAVDEIMNKALEIRKREDVEAAELLADVIERRREALTTPTAGQPSVNEQPRKLLTGWHEITAALDMTYGDRDKIKDANKLFEGPIRNSGPGTNPMVYLDGLITWWNRLDLKQQELANRRVGERLSAEAHHNYGRDGTAAPEIGGGVKKRRSDRKLA